MSVCRNRVVPADGGAGDVESMLAAGSFELTANGDLEASRCWFDSAYQAAERAGHAGAMAAAVLGFGGLWVHEYRTAEAAALLRARLRQTLALVDPVSGLGLRLRIRLAAETDHLAGGHENVHRLLREARHADDPVALSLALSLTHYCLLGPDHGSARRALAAELLEAGARSARRTDLLMGLLWQVVDMFREADPHAERRLAELRGHLDRQDHRAVRGVVTAMETMLAIRAGRLEEAEKLAHVPATPGSAAGGVDRAGWYGGQLFAVRWFQGRVAELLPRLAEVVHHPELSAVDESVWAALAVSAASGGDRRTAAEALARLCCRGLAGLPRSSTWLVTMNGVVEAAHLLGDADVAGRAYELIRPFADVPMMAGLGSACFGSAQHALGVASLTVGDLDRAVDHFERAVRQNLAMAHRPATALARRRHAQALALRARPADVLAAERLWADVVDDATVLGISLPVAGWPGPHASAAVCIRQGRAWHVGWGVRNAVVPHSVGMMHLAVLLANPGSEISALDLVAGAEALGVGAGAAGSAQAVLDYDAIREYRQRLAQLDAGISEPDSTGGREEIARNRTERDWLVSELAAATGLGGRARKFTDEQERARIAVGKTIRRALARIGEVDPHIAEHLRRHIHTGARCSYRPPRSLPSGQRRLVSGAVATR